MDGWGCIFFFNKILIHFRTSCTIKICANFRSINFFILLKLNWGTKTAELLFFFFSYRSQCFFSYFHRNILFVIFDFLALTNLSLSSFSSAECRPWICAVLHSTPKASQFSCVWRAILFGKISLIYLLKKKMNRYPLRFLLIKILLFVFVIPMSSLSSFRIK
jgi:hypothetical protein